MQYNTLQLSSVLCGSLLALAGCGGGSTTVTGLTETSTTPTDSSTSSTAASTASGSLTASDLPTFNRLPVLVDEDGNPNDAAATYTLTATPNVNVTINAPGKSWVTPMSRYNGLQLPPLIKAKRGDAMKLNLVNKLVEASTIHWHGFKIPGDQDGGPDVPVAAGASKQYHFTMSQPAAPLWFHPHPDMMTGMQVYDGLAGVFTLSDPISEQLQASKQLPAGQYDIPVLVQDRRFNAEANGVRTLAYKTLDSDSDGMLGNEVVVNGSIMPKLEVATRQYRFSVYNASNARQYDFALSDGSNFKVVGTDGGLLPSPVETSHIMLGAGERAEIVVDFRHYRVGDKVKLISQAFPGEQMDAMMPADTTGARPANGTLMDIMRFDVTTQASDDVSLYAALPANADINTQRLTASDATKTRNFIFGMSMGNSSSMGSGGGMGNMVFTLNGKTFDMGRIDETIKLAEGNTEIWSVQNPTPMPHPFHAHAIQWQILSRNGVPATGVDLGWKDTVLVQTGETVNMIGRFDPAINVGDYMYHCHILEHEDAGLMGFFRIQ